MDTRQLKYILAIAECGSISKAADKLFISQSGETGGKVES